MQTKIAEFTIEYQQYLETSGKLTDNLDNLPKFINNVSLLQSLYQQMVLTRLFDAKAIALQRTGKLGTYPSTLGQEAIGVAIGNVMQATDVLCPYYRENGAQFARGVKMEEILVYWGGSEIGSCFAADTAKQDLPICIPIASQCLHAAGIATAIKLRKQQRAVVVVLGDGATSRGDFYEAINVAGVWGLPLVFIINNNQWAISVPNDLQTGAKTFAQKAIAAGINCLQIDGNDILVLYDIVDKALAMARNKYQPMVIEAITYRMCDHTTADDASRYRNQEEVQAAQTKDPILRLKKYLHSINAWGESQEQDCKQQSSNKIAAAVDNYLAMPKQSADSIVDYLYQH